MSFFKVDKSIETVREGGESNFIFEGGIYDVVIKHLWVNTNTKGARVINVQIEHNGTTQNLFNFIRLDNNDGKPNLEARYFNNLCIVTDIEPNDPEKMSIPVGAKKALSEEDVITDFDDVEVTLFLKPVYSKYNDKIYKKMGIYGIYRTSDKATATEIVNNSKEMGKKYNKDMTSVFNPVLKNDVTQEDVDEYESQWSSTPTKEDKEMTKTEQVSSEDAAKLFG